MAASTTIRTAVKASSPESVIVATIKKVSMDNLVKLMVRSGLTVPEQREFFRAVAEIK